MALAGPFAKRRLSDLTSHAAVLTALDEYRSTGRDAFLKRYGFGRSKDFLVRDPRNGELADSKAIAAVALHRQWPDAEPLTAADFSGGEATVVPRLEALGFQLERIGGDWSRQEVAAIVADYLSMLTRELTGQAYSKAAHRRAVLLQLNGRSETAVEFKHCNISAVMLELGFPYLRGYKPRSNFQRQLLLEVVSDQIARHRVLDEAAMSAVQRPVDDVEIADFRDVTVAAPQRSLAVQEDVPAYMRPIKRDYLEREAANRSLGAAGELFALRFERWRLQRLGADRWAERVEHVSQTRGDGLGYDILSFEPDGRERFIEVKTTSFGQRTPFFVSANELRFAQAHEETFRLYRLYDFRAAPRMFDLAGRIERHCTLDPSSYRASFG